jgi:hypothetical protein
MIAVKAELKMYLPKGAPLNASAKFPHRNWSGIREKEFMTSFLVLRELEIIHKNGNATAKVNSVRKTYSRILWVSFLRCQPVRGSFLY